MTEEKANIEKQKAKEGMVRFREHQSVDDKDVQLEETRERMEELRKMKSEAEADYERVVNKQRTRNWRSNLSGKEHLEANLKSKKGMNLFKTEGRMMKFGRRVGGRKKSNNWDENFDWEGYMRKSNQHKDILEKNQPDIVKIINEKHRAEQEIQSKGDCESGYWHYHGESGEYYWTGDTEPPENMDTFCLSPLSPKKMKIFKERELELMEEFREQKKKEQKEKDQKRYQERKKAMEIPIDPLPERELCEYEKIRKDNINERKEAMAACGFFENIAEYKKEINFYGNNEQKKKKPKKDTKVKRAKLLRKESKNEININVVKEINEPVNKKEEKIEKVINPSNEACSSTVARDEWYYFEIE